jgi:hypothetical protein
LAQAEGTASIDRKASWDVLAHISHLILTGHTHGAVRPHDQVAARAFWVSAGATFAGASHPNHIRIFQISDEFIEYRTLAYDPSRPSQPWFMHEERGRLPLDRGAEPKTSTSVSFSLPDLTLYRRAMRGLAAELIAIKQQAARRTATTPELVDLPVVVVPEQMRHEQILRTQRALESQPRDERLLREAVGRRSFLLGDMGSGKSTAVAVLVQQLLDAGDNRVPILVPAKRLSGKGVDGPRAFLETVSTFVHEVVAPGQEQLDLVRLASKRVALLVVIDGLDELDHGAAVAVAQAAGGASDAWLDVNVLLTGRPVELRGLDYRGWQVLHTRPLTDDELLRMLVAEARVQTDDQASAEDRAQDLLRRVASSASLRAILATPLAVRMFFDALRAESNPSAATMGDLVGRSCLARVGGWAEQDNKGEPYKRFIATFPDGYARLVVAARLAAAARGADGLPRSAALELVEEIAREAGASEARPVANEALGFLEAAGVLREEGGLRVPLAAVEEYLVGYGLADTVRRGGEAPVDVVQDWRVVAFAAAAGRLLGCPELLAPWLQGVVAELVTGARDVPGSAIVVSESENIGLAESWIGHLAGLDWRPLGLLPDEAGESARAIAHAIHLAGNPGFDWMIQHYLDPRDPYPIMRAGAFDSVFQQWAAIAADTLDEDKKDRLSLFAAAHLNEQSWVQHALQPAMAAVMPDRFAPDVRFKSLAATLWRRPLKDRATSVLSEALKARDPDAQSALEFEAQRGYESAFRCAVLWLAYVPLLPSPAVVTAVLGAKERGWISEREWLEALAECRRRLGEARWTQVLRWLLFSDDSRAAAGAALAMFLDGERSLVLLGPALYRALHDGAYVRGAKEALAGVLERAGPQGYAWLAEQMGTYDEAMGHVPSRAWLLLLEWLEHADDSGVRLLQVCIRGTAGFLLPRYPDIRGALGRLIRGRYGSSYRSMLESSLRSPDALVRHGAAVVLTVTEPASFPLAVEETVRAADGGPHALEYEWVPLLASLDLGPTAAHLGRAATDFPPRAQALARLLACHAGVLDEGSRKRLVTSLLRGRHNLYAHPDLLRSVLDDGSSLEMLRAALMRGVGKEAAQAAEFLLEFHANRLSGEERGRCDALTLGRATRSVRVLDHVLKRAGDLDWRRGVANVDEARRAEQGRRPFISLLVDGLEQGEWADFLPVIVFGDPEELPDSDQGEAWVAWLIAWGRANPGMGSVVGVAARQLFAIWKEIAGRTQRNEVPWLALLGDALGGMEQAVLREAVEMAPGYPRVELRIALRARLEAPRPLPRHALLPQHAQSPPEPTAGSPVEPPPCSPGEIAQLHELVRPSEVFPLRAIPMLHTLVWDRRGPFVSLLPKEGTGRNYALIRGALSWIETGEADFACVLAFLPVWVEEHEARQTHGLRHLERIWRLVHLGGARQDASLRVRLVARLRDQLLDSPDIAGDSRVAAVGLLSLRGRLEPDETPVVVLDMAKYWYADRFDLVPLMVDWLGSDRINDTDRVTLRRAVGPALAAVDAQHAHRDEGWEPIVPLYLALTWWALGGPLDDGSARVFARGLGWIRRRGGWSDHQLDLADLKDLIVQVPRGVLRGALEAGTHAADAGERAACTLFLTAFEPRQDNG